MPVAESTYLADITAVMKKHWPDNRTVNVVCHGHSVPSGYFATPFVDSMNAYPHLLLAALKQRFPYAVVNVIVTAIGGENSASGAVRFETEVLNHRPDVVTVDYGLNDRGLGLEKAAAAWRGMIAAAQTRGVRVILMTPTADLTMAPGYAGKDKGVLAGHAAQIRALAAEYGTGLVDSYAAFEAHMRSGDLTDLLSWSNHPNRRGHDLVAGLLLRWFPAA